MGKGLIVIGAILILAGLLITYFDKVPWLGKLPGDIFIDRGNFKLYFPIATSLLLSILLTLILYLIRRLKG